MVQIELFVRACWSLPDAWCDSWSRRLVDAASHDLKPHVRQQNLSLRMLSSTLGRSVLAIYGFPTPAMSQKKVFMDPKLRLVSPLL